MIPWVSLQSLQCGNCTPTGGRALTFTCSTCSQVNVLNDGASLLANTNPPSPLNFIRKNMSPALVWIRHQSRTYSYIPDVRVRVVHPKMYWCFLPKRIFTYTYMYIFFSNMHISMFYQDTHTPSCPRNFYWLLYILFLPLGFVSVGGELAEARARIFHTEWVAGAVTTHGKGACHLEVSQMTGFFRGKLQICCCW